MSGGDRAIVIYLDVYFGTNLIMDYIVLYIVNKVCRFAANKLRVLLSATLGAVWSVVAVMLPKEIHFMVLICTYVLISFLMVKMCACGFKFRDVLKGVVTLYGVTFVMAGCMHMLYYYTYAGYLIRLAALKDTELLVFAGVSLVLLYLIMAQFLRVKNYGDKICKVCVEIKDSRIELKGMIDTGNVLTDPYCHKPVCVAGKKRFSNVLSDINDLKYHIIPFRSLGCDSGLLEVITADNMYIYYEDREIKVTDALIGLYDMNLSTDNEYEMLINAKVLEN